MGRTKTTPHERRIIEAERRSARSARVKYLNWLIPKPKLMKSRIKQCSVKLMRCDNWIPRLTSTPVRSSPQSSCLPMDLDMSGISSSEEESLDLDSPPRSPPSWTSPPASLGLPSNEEINMDDFFSSSDSDILIDASEEESLSAIMPEESALF